MCKIQTWSIFELFENASNKGVLLTETRHSGIIIWDIGFQVIFDLNQVVSDLSKNKFLYPIYIEINKFLVQGVLALCEFHYCEFRYCGFSKLLLKFG